MLLDPECVDRGIACAVPLDLDLVRIGLRDRDPALRTTALQIALPSNFDLGELGQLARARPALIAIIRLLVEEFEDPRVGPILASLPPSPDTEEGAS